MAERAEQQQSLAGWGRTSPSTATVLELPADGVAAVVGQHGPRGLLARGLGRSYGDAAQNAGGDVVRVVPGPVEVDEHALTVTTSAGTSLHEVMRALLPRGLFPMTTPGTRYVTVGGSIACDVHGKNHHQVGSFGAHVTSMEMVTGDGAVRLVTPDSDPDLFWATVGGMGLTGVITRATFRVARVPSAFVRVDTERFADLDALMDRMVRLDAERSHSVAWLDVLAGGSSLGRSVLTTGEFAQPGELRGRAAAEPFRLPDQPRLRVPVPLPLNVVRPVSVRVFNELWFRKARPGTDAVQHVSSFFHPLDGVADWNRVYGPAGFIQYQFVVPDDARDTMHRILELLVRSRRASFLNVLKRFGPGNPGFLSFPTSGWTLAVDVAADPGVAPLLEELDEAVLAAGGRIYLGKDARLRPEAFRAMYPRAGELESVRRRTGAVGVLTSDLARRLGLEVTGPRKETA